MSDGWRKSTLGGQAGRSLWRPNLRQGWRKSTKVGLAGGGPRTCTLVAGHPKMRKGWRKMPLEILVDGGTPHVCTLVAGHDWSRKCERCSENRLWRLGRWRHPALSHLRCRSVWKPKVRGGLTKIDSGRPGRRAPRSFALLLQVSMEVESGRGVTRIDSGRLGRWRPPAVLHLSCRSLWRPKMQEGWQKSILGGLASGGP